jgi:hypothetical protein
LFNKKWGRRNVVNALIRAVSASLSAKFVCAAVAHVNSGVKYVLLADVYVPQCAVQSVVSAAVYAV